MNAGRILATMAIMAGVTSTAAAQQTTQVVTFQVAAINQIAVTGAPSLTINTATAGSAPTDATASVTWAITTNQTGQKVTASLDSDMPAGLTLSASLAAPGGATSAGAVSLSSSDADVVTDISTATASGLNLTYTLSATAAAGVVASSTRTVTYTITAGP